MGLFHRHKWKNLSVNHVDVGRMATPWSTPILIGSRTKVLRICTDCQQTSIRVLSGTWTLEELNAGA